MPPKKKQTSSQTAPSREIKALSGVGSDDDEMADTETESITQIKEVAKLVEEMPKPVRRRFELSMMQMFGPGSMPHPLFGKFTAEHIDKFLDYSQQDDLNQYKYHSTNRWFQLAYAVLAALVFLLMIFFFANDRATLVEILKLLVVFGGGLGSGYGLRAYRERK